MPYSLSFRKGEIKQTKKKVVGLKKKWRENAKYFQFLFDRKLDKNERIRRLWPLFCLVVCLFVFVFELMFFVFLFFFLVYRRENSLVECTVDVFLHSFSFLFLRPLSESLSTRSERTAFIGTFFFFFAVCSFFVCLAEIHRTSSRPEKTKLYSPNKKCNR